MNRKMVETLKNTYQRGTRIKLIHMEGEPRMHNGLVGTVKLVDDIGQVHVNWDNGSSLALNHEVDTFQIMKG